MFHKFNFTLKANDKYYKHIHFDSEAHCTEEVTFKITHTPCRSEDQHFL